MPTLVSLPTKMQLLLLPYKVGGPDEHARYNDQVPFASPSKNELCQTKVNVFVPGHITQLRLILDSWRRMVEKGRWVVGADGVEGGIEKWREVDQGEDLARRYTTDLHW